MLKKTFKIFKGVATITGMVVIAFFVVSIFIWGFDSDRFEYDKNESVNSGNLHNEGPFVFESDSAFEAFYIGGDKSDGYYLRNEIVDKAKPTSLVCHYFPDSSAFQISLYSSPKTPAAHYSIDDTQKIIAISDIEGSYKALRNFLVANQVVDEKLNWIFGNNHLVLNGDMVDRGYFVTQVLWLIYKLDYQAMEAGGHVHFILGNHDIMNMQGDFRYAKTKYKYASRILDIRHVQLFDQTTVLGKWIMSKNIAEKINDYLFVHAGIHPKLVQNRLDVETINRVAKRGYFKPYFHLKNAPIAEELIRSSKYSPYWYRGYFRENLSVETIDTILNFYNCKHIVVGHTVQENVRGLYNGKVIAIDVLHPADDAKHFPKRNALGLLIENGKMYQVDDEGRKIEL